MCGNQFYSSKDQDPTDEVICVSWSSWITWRENIERLAIVLWKFWVPFKLILVKTISWMIQFQRQHETCLLSGEPSFKWWKVLPANIWKMKRKFETHKRKTSTDSDLSSLGPLPDTADVTRQFSEQSEEKQRTDSSSSRAGRTHRQFGEGSSTGISNTQISFELETRPSLDIEERNALKICPHCNKTFTNAWAVPKHISVCFKSSSYLKKNRAPTILPTERTLILSWPIFTWYC